MGAPAGQRVAWHREHEARPQASPHPGRSRPRSCRLITVYGVVVLSFMMAMYALEARGAMFVLAFAVGCALSGVYGFASGAWPFGVVEAVWSGVALRRFLTRRARAR